MFENKRMSLATDYRRQFQWRDWQTILDELPPLQDQTVIDLGCGVGDLASELAARGADVVAVDTNEDLLEHARSRQIPRVEFRAFDLRGAVELGIAAHGIWSSFTAAYFVDLSGALTLWTRNLKPGGWIAITEIDDLFAHEPLSAHTKALLNAYCDDSLAAGRYDFRAGRKLKGCLENAGFSVTRSLSMNDRELSFSGPADAGVLDAWRARFERMKLLQDFLGIEFDRVREEFLGCLMRADHRSIAEVRCCIAIKGSI
jgi:SAM-dependent methyltransferase